MKAKYIITLITIVTTFSINENLFCQRPSNGAIIIEPTSNVHDYFLLEFYPETNTISIESLTSSTILIEKVTLVGISTMHNSVLKRNIEIKPNEIIFINITSNLESGIYALYLGRKTRGYYKLYIN